MSESYEEHRHDDIPSIVSEEIDEEHTSHQDAESGVAEALHKDGNDDSANDAAAPPELEAEHEVSSRESADRHVQSHAEDIEYPDALPSQPDKSSDAEDEPAGKRAGTAPFSHAERNARSDSTDRADAENEQLFNLYQQRLDSKPLGSARQSNRPQPTSKAQPLPRPTPRGDSYVRRGSAGLVRGNSLMGTPRQSVVGNESAVAFRRRASVLSSARYNAARASIGGTSHYSVDRRRSSVPVTEGEQLALEKMEENEARRLEARARAELIQAYREEDAVEIELEKEQAAHARLVARVHDQERQRQERLRAKWERQEQARKRREAREEERKAQLESRIATAREVHADPFKMMMAKRRYSGAVTRGDQPVSPQRRIAARQPANGATANGAPSSALADSQQASTGAREDAAAPASASDTPRTRRSSVQEARDMWRAPAPRAEKTKAWR